MSDDFAVRVVTVDEVMEHPEGCVVRSQDGLRGAKVINPEYLLNKNNTDFH